MIRVFLMCVLLAFDPSSPPPLPAPPQPNQPAPQSPDDEPEDLPDVAPPGWILGIPWLQRWPLIRTGRTRGGARMGVVR